jgi:hypothetical protein
MPVFTGMTNKLPSDCRRGVALIQTDQSLVATYRPLADLPGVCCGGHKESFLPDSAKNLHPTEKYPPRHSALASFLDISAADKTLALTAKKLATP